MEINPEIVKYVAWPICVTINFVIFIFFFRKDISSVFPRISSISRSGITTTPNPEAQREIPNRENLDQLIPPPSGTKVEGDIDKSLSNDTSTQKIHPNREVVEKLMSVASDSPLLRETETMIVNGLASKGLETEGDTVKVLSRFLATTTLLLEFEQVHGLIFGSQIFLLKKLNEVAGQGRPKGFIENHFESVRNLFPNAFNSWSLDQYLDFLKSRYLIAVEGEAFHISVRGIEYLTWIARHGKSEDKPL